MESEQELIMKYALQNAVRYGGKAEQGRIIGKILGERPELRDKIKDMQKEIADIVKKINNMSSVEQVTELERLAPGLIEKKETEQRSLPELRNARNGNVVMRFAPSPSGPMHLGHAMTLSVISEYRDMYEGKLIFRIEDTNPDNIYKPAYDIMPKEAEWLTGGKVDEVIIQSDHIPIYYDYIEKFLDKDAVYVCTCEPEKFREMLTKSIPCPCRGLSADEQRKRWKKMFEGYSQGEAVLRLKTDIRHKNPAMRDFPIMRINESEHPRQGRKYRVWPLMNLSVLVDDIESGMTHILRGKDHADNAKRQELMYKLLGMPIPETNFQGKINFIGMQMSSSKTKKAIQDGEFDGWDDIRLAFLGALKRRGYQPEALRRWAVSMGVSLADKKVSKEELFKVIDSFNRDTIDPVSNRYFFVKDPVRVKIENSPAKDIELDLHPDTRKGGRKFRTGDEFYITKEDLDSFLEGELLRLMDCINFRKVGNKLVFDSLEYEKFKNTGKKIIHWLPSGEKLVETEVLMPDKTLVKGLAEHLAGKLRVNDIVQLERFGFCRLDKRENEKLIFWFTHK